MSWQGANYTSSNAVTCFLANMHILPVFVPCRRRECNCRQYLLLDANTPIIVAIYFERVPDLCATEKACTKQNSTDVAVGSDLKH